VSVAMTTEASTLEIREVRPEELAAAGAVTVQAFAAEYAVLGYYEAHLADVGGRTLDATVLVAVVDGEVVGNVTYVSDARSALAEHQREDESSIRMLAVLPTYRRRGIARALTQACIDRARRDGKRRLLLHADEVMQGSRRLYESLGFERDPERDYWPDPETSLVAYVLDLRVA
jgi:ribosomal protein S18 acetylase RimI-like enzyme